MKTRTIHETNMLRSILRFAAANPAILAFSRVPTLLAVIQSAADSVDAAAADQVFGRDLATGGVVTRRENARQLRDFLKDLARVGRSLDPETYPGITAKFILPRSKAIAALTAFARTIVATTTALEPEFLARGFPGDFLATLQAHITALDQATDTKIQGLQKRVGSTSALKHRAADGVRAAQELDAIMRAHLRNDPVTLAVWKHARHIETPAQRKDATLAVVDELGTLAPSETANADTILASAPSRTPAAPLPNSKPIGSSASPFDAVMLSHRSWQGPADRFVSGDIPPSEPAPL